MTTAYIERLIHHHLQNPHPSQKQKQRKEKPKVEEVGDKAND